MKKKTPKPDEEKILRGLKAFQRDAVEYVFHRLYTDKNPTRRFLIADEVGLGKTLVARGIIAKTINHLWKDIDRIDVVYICSNAGLARQNINRLNVLGDKRQTLVDRITLLPTTIKGIKKNKINFIPLTPGTSFDLRSSMGRRDERVLLYWLLDKAWRLRDKGVGPMNVLQGYVQNTKGFRWWIHEYQNYHNIDKDLAVLFRKSLRARIRKEREEGKMDLRTRFIDLCHRFKRSRKHIPWQDQRDRSALIGELRMLLASTCIEALEPDLVILDEFQRFKDLLIGNTDASRLAKNLFEYSDEQADVRVLLLSATPYKMYTIYNETDTDNHYKDFLDTLSFLDPKSVETRHYDKLLQEYRWEIYNIGNGEDEKLFELKEKIEKTLRQLMIRTERLSVSSDRNGMLKQVKPENISLKPNDARAYATLQKVARHLRHSDILDYWKSAPYLLNFMDHYKFKRTFVGLIDRPDSADHIAEILKKNMGLMISWDDVRAYEQIDPGNVRMRSLIDGTINQGVWQLLWIPPALPYYRLGPPFSNPDFSSFTKRLIFSRWSVVPKVISTMVSYEAERRAFRSFESNPENSPEARKRRRGLLQFAESDGRLTGMPVLGMIYPSTTLASIGDPLRTLHHDDSSSPPPVSRLIREIRHLLKDRLDGMLEDYPYTGRADVDWYWAAPILLDLDSDEKATMSWFDQQNLASIWAGEDPEAVRSTTSRWFDHVEKARELLSGSFQLGRPPKDLSRVLAQMAVAGPAVCALRALSRKAGEGRDLSDTHLKNKAGQIAWAFRSLFNNLEAMSIIRGLNPSEPYWLRTIEYSLNGGLQSVLDEYVHVLKEFLGFVDQSDDTALDEITQSICSVVSLRTSSMEVDQIFVTAGDDPIKMSKRGMRGHFALRFGEQRSEEGYVVSREDQVRHAFNSPFWPFVLASTSIGQEGLDFHIYCHAVVHWNLPSNPVDMEQREGCVHRYKGHAVRKNLAGLYHQAIGRDGGSDPWEEMFVAASKEHASKTRGLSPYWILNAEDGAQIERHVLVLPLSRDNDQLEALRRSLVVYRMVFGQPRQEDLLNYLIEKLSKEEIERYREALRIDLSPRVER